MDKPMVFEEHFNITRKEKEFLNNHKAFVIWFTGLSGSGKSTLARILEEKLFNESKRILVLDGDNTRLGINKDLGFSEKDRKENIRRIAEISKLVNDSGTIVIASFISPYENDRTMAKEIIGVDSFVEVYISTPISVCIERDPKGLYKKAISGQLHEFTGIDSPYEIPSNPDIIINTEKQTIKESIEPITYYLKQKGWI